MEKRLSVERNRKYLGLGSRCLALFLLSIIGLGTWVSYDSAAAIQNVFMKDMNINNTEFSLVYSVCAWPNILLCLVGGYLIDRFFGIRLGMIVYCVVATLGQLIFTLGVLYVDFTVILIGKLIFGIGMEAVFICLQFYAVHLFPCEQVPLITCILFSFIRLGSSLIYFMAPSVYTMFLQHYSSVTSLSALFDLTVGVLVLSILCAVIVSIMSAKVDDSKTPIETEQSVPLTHHEPTPKCLSERLSSLMEQISFPPRFWILCLVNVSYTTALYVFLPFSQRVLVADYKMEDEEANMVPTVHFIISALFSPVIGWSVDKLAFHIDMNILMGCGILSSSVAYLLLALTRVTPYVPLIVLSVSYAVWTSLLTPIISRSVSSDKLATAFGMCQSLFNLMYSINVVLAGYIQEITSGYTYLYIFILVWIAVGLVAVLLLSLRISCPTSRKDSSA